MNSKLAREIAKIFGGKAKLCKFAKVLAVEDFQGTCHLVNTKLRLLELEFSVYDPYIEIYFNKFNIRYDLSFSINRSFSFLGMSSRIDDELFQMPVFISAFNEKFGGYHTFVAIAENCRKLHELSLKKDDFLILMRNQFVLRIMYESMSALSKQVCLLSEVILNNGFITISRNSVKPME